jgi:hypothetical protein
MRMTDSSAQTNIQFRAVENHLFRMDRFYGINWHREFPSVLYIDDQLGSATRSDRPDRAKLFATIRYKCLESDLDFLLHDLLRVVPIFLHYLCPPPNVAANPRIAKGQWFFFSRYHHQELGWRLNAHHHPLIVAKVVLQPGVP